MEEFKEGSRADPRIVQVTKKCKKKQQNDTGKRRRQSLVGCTTCRLFRSQSQMTTEGPTGFGRCKAEAPFGEAPWRGRSKRLVVVVVVVAIWNYSGEK